MGLKWECPADQTCSTWALSYFLDCICNDKDIISFFLGITSIICWAVAEIPQILVNWSSGNVESVSLAFIFTWMIGDVFNLLGCWINPGTLPTQFYLAVLYSSTTLLLVVKQLWSSCASCQDSIADEALLGHGRSNARPVRGPSDLEESFFSDATLAITPLTQSLPVMSKRGRPPLHVTASLPVRAYSRESEPHTGSPTTQSNARSPIAYSGSWRRLTLSSSYSGSGSPTARGLIFSSLVVVGVTVSALSSFDGKQGLKQQGTVSSGGGEKRQLLQEDDGKDLALSVGLILGWLMTCIYLTGRLPQIILNWSRDFVIGVSVQTIVFAFLGNAAYLGSILVRGVGWSRLKPVLPWVVDISCCLCMDIFVSSPTHKKSHMWAIFILPHSCTCPSSKFP